MGCKYINSVLVKMNANIYFPLDALADVIQWECLQVPLKP